VVIML